MHYLSSLQCILAAQSKNIVFLQNTLSLFCLSLCLSLFLFVSRLVKKKENSIGLPRLFHPSFSCTVCLVRWCSYFALYISVSFISPPPPSLSPPTLMASFVHFQVFDVFHILTFHALSHPDTHVQSLSTPCPPFLLPPGVCYLTCEASIHLCLSVPSSHIPRLSLKSSEQ